MEKLPLTNWFGWAEVVGTARHIVNSTAPGDCCYMSEDSIAIFNQLAELTPMQQAFLAKALQDAEQLENVALLGDKHAVATLLKQEGRK